MGLPKSGDAASRFSAYVEGLASVIGHADRAKPLRDYCVGLMMPCERKSVEPMAAITAPERTAAQHQSLLHFVGEGNWSDEKVLAKVRELVLPEMERHGPIEAWIIDDTGFPKKGRHSVGVGRQYCGELGKQDNCQIAVTLSIANHHASLPAAYRLYLPKEWATDRTRRRKAGVPKEVTFKTKPAIALEQLRWASAAGLPRGVVLMDAGYGADSDLRTNITALGLSYVAGIMPQTSVWAPGTGPQPPKNWSGCGRPPKLLRRDGKHQPISVKKLAFALPSKAWRKITWREATAEPLSSRFARVRVRAAHRDYWLAESRPEEWLLIEWPEGEEAPTKYWFSTLPANIAFHQLVDTAKLRWRIERDYQELKQEVGLGHFEGRGWRGFHHHATLCIAAYGFLVSERETIPPLYGALGVKHKLSMWQLGIGIETADMSTNTSQVAAACGPTPTRYARDDSRGARHLAPFIAPQPCIRWIHWDPDHDATMRIGGEAPGRRAHSQERL
jgi:SRSO17 transposase